MVPRELPAGLDRDDPAQLTPGSGGEPIADLADAPPITDHEFILYQRPDLGRLRPRVINLAWP